MNKDNDLDKFLPQILNIFNVSEKSKYLKLDPTLDNDYIVLVKNLNTYNFSDCHIVFFSAGSEVSKKFTP